MTIEQLLWTAIYRSYGKILQKYTKVCRFLVLKVNYKNVKNMKRKQQNTEKENLFVVKSQFETVEKLWTQLFSLFWDI